MKKQLLIVAVALFVGVGLVACGGMSPAPATASTNAIVPDLPNDGGDITGTTADLSNSGMDLSDAIYDEVGKCQVEKVTDGGVDLDSLASDLVQGKEVRSGDGSYTDTIL